MNSDSLSQETAYYLVSQARSSKERALAFLLWASLLAHGLFFPRELAAMALVPGGYLLLRRRELGDAIHSLRFPQEGLALRLNATDLLLLLMSGLSFLGLAHPVKADEAWLDAMRFLLYWFVYRWGREVAQDAKLEKRLLKTIGWAALALAVSAWLPWSAHIWPPPGPPEAGRLSSWLGYPNATAAFLAAVLLLPGLNGWLKIFLFLAFLSTGSRASLGLFLVIKSLQWVAVLKLGTNLHSQAKFRSWLSSKPWLGPGSWSWLKRKSGKLLKARKNTRTRNSDFRLRISILGVAFLSGIALLGWGAGLVSPAAPFHRAWEHLSRWRVSPSVLERILYIHDGLILAWRGKFLPQAGGWLAFPLIQQIPYWSADPHSSLIRVLLNQGLAGLLAVGAWIVKRLDGVRRSDLFWACLFLALHSLVDADFSFGALGIIFWLLVGLAESRIPSVEGWRALGVEQREKLGRAGPGRRLRTQLGRQFRRARSGLARNRILQPVFLQAAMALGLFALAAVFLVGGGLPQAMGVMGQKQAPVAGQIAVTRYQEARIRLEKDIALDRADTLWRRQLAEIELSHGDLVQGLKDVERVLAWKKFDLGSYEWAQGVVWRAAEEQRSQGNPADRGLYLWVANVPSRIIANAQAVPLAERSLWKGYALYHVTPHIKLLAGYARDQLMHMH